ncbi:TIGR03756 family integrating conjugative element protein [Dickeya oryzae]|uniref:TIGR03756 family integrating conjugative element protein n=1 Tax=Dickeya oryzae TaxID=1240404 RepID=A0AB39IPZ4_9GAMM|nr:TIGR03756 family integrating conjugative element protein [Dickeya oryzae]MCA6990794.1 TIGR03756 family integrating conjugative element protein [Dickeya oryzae]
MNMTLKTRRMLMATLLSVSGLTTASVNTAQIVASASSVSCISWRVKGICYWLLCTPFGCSVKTSVRVEHFIPEAVVSAYGNSGDNPWTEMSLVSQSAASAEGGLIGSIAGVVAGGGNQELKAPEAGRKKNLRYLYSDAIGHPATSLIGGMVPGYSCRSAALPLNPYFLSSLDALFWRTSLPESLYPEALIPGQRELGSQTGGNMWGNIYPRSGFVTQQDGYKAAALVAQRTADVITRNGQLHIYQALVGTPSPGYWPPEPVTENTGTTNHKWQALAPQLSMSCAIFPDNVGQASMPYSEQGNYAWALWQPYSCCQRRGQTLLYTTDI